MGVIRAGAEADAFLDPACPPTPEHDVLTFPTAARQRVHSTSNWKRMNQILRRDKGAFIVIRGIFDGPKRDEGPLPNETRLQHILRGGNKGFGHMGVARFQLRIEVVEFVAPAGQ